jgi:hypothetical protein
MQKFTIIERGQVVRTIHLPVVPRIGEKITADQQHLWLITDIIYTDRESVITLVVHRFSKTY